MLRTSPRVFAHVDQIAPQVRAGTGSDALPEISGTRVAVLGPRQQRTAAILSHARRLTFQTRAAIALVETPEWWLKRCPFDDLPARGPLVLWARDLHEAFPTGQSGSTRCVLTHSMYQLQRLLDWARSRGDVTVLLDAEPAALRQGAPEAFAARGPWSAIQIVELPNGDASEQDAASMPEELDGMEPSELLAIAFRSASPETRLAACRRAAEALTDDVSVHVALGSAYMEVQDLDASRAALERALALAPDWEATHYEYGKLWLRLDDMERAREAFGEAGRLMPTFSAAFSNLGATLGELDRPQDALAALQQALGYDPNGYPILNNIGVVSRELGRLAESEAAFRQVVSIAPDFVFGHYNLGHTLFLQGRYQAALAAYSEGQRRDPEKNPRQACRLAVVRLAAGDPDGALRDLQRYSAQVRGDQKRELLEEAQEILWALLSTDPALPGWRRVADVVKSELAALGSSSER